MRRLNMEKETIENKKTVVKESVPNELSRCENNLDSNIEYIVSIVERIFVPDEAFSTSLFQKMTKRILKCLNKPVPILKNKKEPLTRGTALIIVYLLVIVIFGANEFMFNIITTIFFIFALLSIVIVFL